MPGDMTPFTAAAVIYMGVLGANGVIVSGRDLVARINIEDFSTISSSPPKWSNSNLYGFSKLIFHNKTSLEVQSISSSKDGALLDSDVIYIMHHVSYIIRNMMHDVRLV